MVSIRDQSSPVAEQPSRALDKPFHLDKVREKEGEVLVPQTGLEAALLLEEFKALRQESVEARKNQQAIIQWTVAGAGAATAGTAALLALSAQAGGQQLGYGMAFAILAAVVPLLLTSATGIWLGEVYRAERAGRFLREREEAFSDRRDSPLSPHAFESWPVLWETLIHDRRASSFGFEKDRLGATATVALFGGLYYIALAGAWVLFVHAPTRVFYSGDTSFGWLIIAAVGIIYPAAVGPRLLMLSRSSRDSPSWSRPLPVHGSLIDLVSPCRNEVGAVRWLANRCPAQVTLIIADHQSRDGSTELAQDLGMRVVDASDAKGVGGVVGRGLAASRNEVVCVADCDGTFDPVDIALLTAPIPEGADLVLARRTGLPPLHRIAVWARWRLLRLLVHDWEWRDLGGARAVRRSSKTLPLLAGFDEGTSWTLDWALKAHARHLNVVEVEVPYHSRIGRSKITGRPIGYLGSAARALTTILRAKPWRA